MDDIAIIILCLLILIPILFFPSVWYWIGSNLKQLAIIITVLTLPILCNSMSSVYGGNSLMDFVYGGAADTEIKTTERLMRFSLKPRDGHTIDPVELKKLSQEVLNIFSYQRNPSISHLADCAETADEFSRILKPDAPRGKYTRRALEFKRVLHWGQLKLMLTEVEFLSMVLERYNAAGDNRPVYMVYAGAAPGHHTVYLQKLFPDVHFELYDPNPFAIKDTDHIKTHVQFFTDADSQYWKEQTDKYIVFCSDVRIEPATNENIKKDMRMQLGWWKIMNPELSMFKFRLPWDEGQTEYPDGDIYIQPYPGPTSTETRLIVKKDAAIIKYDNRKYEEQCFFHNTSSRLLCYENILGNNLGLRCDGIDNCYDCTSFINIIDRYLNVIGFKGDLDNRKTEIRRLVKEVQNNITFGKHNIYNQTIRSFNDILNTIHTRLYATCNRKICSLDCFNRRKEKKGEIVYRKKWGHVSKATEEATAKAIEEATLSKSK